MASKEEKNDSMLLEILKSLEEKQFHGSVTIHYTFGKPRKIEYKMVEDLSDPQSTVKERSAVPGTRGK